MMIGFDVFGDSDRAVPDAEAPAAVQDFMRSKGIITQFIQRNRFRVLPPLVVGKSEIDSYIAALDEAMTALSRGAIRPQPPQNPYTAAFAAKRASGLKGAIRWAWSHSPEHWMAKVRERIKGKA